MQVKTSPILLQHTIKAGKEWKCFRSEESLTEASHTRLNGLTKYVRRCGRGGENYRINQMYWPLTQFHSFQGHNYTFVCSRRLWDGINIHYRSFLLRLLFFVSRSTKRDGTKLIFILWVHLASYQIYFVFRSPHENELFAHVSSSLTWEVYISSQTARLYTLLFLIHVCYDVREYLILSFLLH